MKKSRSNRAIIALTVILIAAASAVSFIKSNDNKKKDWTMYYWFDADGNYLYRQNTIDSEIFLTGLDEFLLAPLTLQERGYAPTMVIGTNPPIPVLPYLPNKRLYSHP